MIPLLQLNRKLQYLFIALLLASFAIAQSGRAVTPEPDPGTGEPTTATGLQASEFEPNRRAFRFLFQEPLQCAGGMTTIRGELVVGFQYNPETVRVEPVYTRLISFSGNSPRGELEVESRAIGRIHLIERTGQWAFDIVMIVTGPALPEGMRLKVEFNIRYTAFLSRVVTEFDPDGTPTVSCICESNP